jgi:hypothetical protein
MFQQQWQINYYSMGEGKSLSTWNAGLPGEYYITGDYELARSLSPGFCNRALQCIRGVLSFIVYNPLSHPLFYLYPDQKGKKGGREGRSCRMVRLPLFHRLEKTFRN